MVLLSQVLSKVVNDNGVVKFVLLSSKFVDVSSFFIKLLLKTNTNKIGDYKDRMVVN